MAHTFVDNDDRDSVFQTLMQHHDNKKCMDCPAKHPKWASVTYGIFLCYNCTSRHRQYGTHISFVRSCEMDKWNQKQLNAMEIGGNKHFGDFLKKNAISVTQTIDYTNTVLAKYKTDLKKRAEAMYLSQGGSAPAVSNTKPTGLFGTTAQSSTASSSNGASSTSTSNSVNRNTNGNLKSGNGSSNNSMSTHASKDKGVMFGKPSKKSEQVNLGAKKLDNFDFDSFDWGKSSTTTQSNGSFKIAGVSTTTTTETVKEEAVTKSPEVKKEGKTEAIASPAKEETKTESAKTNGFGIKPKNNGPQFIINTGMNDDHDKKKSNGYSSRKAISSRDFFGEDETTEDDRQKFNKYKGAAAISSDQFFDRKASFGEPEDDTEDKVREIALQFGEKAKEFKSKASEYFTNLKLNLQQGRQEEEN